MNQPKPDDLTSSDIPLETTSSFQQVFLFASEPLTSSWMEEMLQRRIVQPDEAHLYSKYFSRLMNSDDYVSLVDSLSAVITALAETKKRLITHFEKAEELYSRWYCMGERSVALKFELTEHLTAGNKYGDQENLLSKEDRLANFRPFGFPQYMPTKAMRNPILILRDLRHFTDTFGLTYLTPLFPKEGLDTHPAQYLGLTRQPVEFVHYANPDSRPEVLFTGAQINYVVERTAIFGYQLLAATRNPDYTPWPVRQANILSRLQRKMNILKKEQRRNQEAQLVGEQILQMGRNADLIDSGFLGFAIGWLGAVRTTFTR
jgi:hypothetical protein